MLNIEARIWLASPKFLKKRAGPIGDRRTCYQTPQCGNNCFLKWTPKKWRPLVDFWSIFVLWLLVDFWKIDQHLKNRPKSSVFELGFDWLPQNFWKNFTVRFGDRRTSYRIPQCRNIGFENFSYKKTKMCAKRKIDQGEKSTKNRPNGRFFKKPTSRWDRNDLDASAHRVSLTGAAGMIF